MSSGMCRRVEDVLPVAEVVVMRRRAGACRRSVGWMRL